MVSKMSTRNLQDEILKFIGKNNAVFLSDIARNFNISHPTAKDIVDVLEKQNFVSVVDKGIAKLVIPKGKVES